MWAPPTLALLSPAALTALLPDLDRDRLPTQLRELVDMCGLEDTFALLLARGGTRLSIPREPHASVVLRAILAPAALAALCRAWGGDTVSLPKADKLVAQVRFRAIRAAEGNASKREVALAFGITVERVRQIWRGGGVSRGSTEARADDALQ